jgi:hypothetical protein
VVPDGAPVVCFVASRLTYANLGIFSSHAGILVGRTELATTHTLCSITPFPFYWRPLLSADAGEPDWLANSGARPLSIGQFCIAFFLPSSGSYA